MIAVDVAEPPAPNGYMRLNPRSARAREALERARAGHGLWEDDGTLLISTLYANETVRRLVLEGWTTSERGLNFQWPTTD